MDFRGERQCEQVAWRLAQPPWLERALPLKLMKVVQHLWESAGPATCSQDLCAWIASEQSLAFAFWASRLCPGEEQRPGTSHPVSQLNPCRAFAWPDLEAYEGKAGLAVARVLPYSQTFGHCNALRSSCAHMADRGLSTDAPLFAIWAIRSARSRLLAGKLDGLLPVPGSPEARS